jgi:hypothetical protein
VYFNLRAPSWFDHGTVTLEYKDEGYSLSGMGAQVGPGFAYHVVSRPSQEVPLADGWVRASYTFSFAGLHQPKNVKRFLLDLQPSRRTGGELLIRDLRVFVTQ